MVFPTLETERLILRELTTEDSEAIYQCFSDERVIRHYGMEKFFSIEQADHFVSTMREKFMNRAGIRWGIERKGESKIIGTIGLNAWLPKHRRAEVGYELNPVYWDKGYATEALKRVLTYGFEEIHLTRIGAVVFEDNESSQKLLTKLRFEKEGVLKKYIYQDGKAYDTIVFARTVS